MLPMLNRILGSLWPADMLEGSGGAIGPAIFRFLLQSMRKSSQGSIDLARMLDSVDKSLVPGGAKKVSHNVESNDKVGSRHHTAVFWYAAPSAKMWLWSPSPCQRLGESTTYPLFWKECLLTSFSMCEVQDAWFVNLQTYFSTCL